MVVVFPDLLRSDVLLIPTPAVSFALCLSLMVLSLLETIFITYLLHWATTQPPPMTQWLHALLLDCTNPRICCPPALWKENAGLSLDSTRPPGKGSQLYAHSLNFPVPPLL